jgi:hypothetical protein
MLSGEIDYSRLVPDVWKADHPEAVREYLIAESRQKEDRKQITRASRIVAAKLKREQTASQLPSAESLVVVDAYTFENDE